MVDTEWIDAEWMGGPNDGDTLKVPNKPRITIEIADPRAPLPWPPKTDTTKPEMTVVISVPLGAWKGKSRLWWAGRNPRV